MNIGKYKELYSEDLIFKNYPHNTIKNYVAQVYLFLRHYTHKTTEIYTHVSTRILNKVNLPI